MDVVVEEKKVNYNQLYSLDAALVRVGISTKDRYLAEMPNLLGFRRFSASEGELVKDFLMKKMAGSQLTPNPMFIVENVFIYSPLQLSALPKLNKEEDSWYFLTKPYGLSYVGDDFPDIGSEHGVIDGYWKESKKGEVPIFLGEENDQPMLIGNEKHLKFIESGGKSKSTFHMVVFRASREVILDYVVTEPGWYLVHLFKIFKYAERDSNLLSECATVRKSKTTSGSSDCFIELLPDELLLRILSFLSFPDAIITSTLSKRWKHLWTLRPSIDFNQHILYDYTDLYSYFKVDLDRRPSYYKGEDATVGEIITGVLSQLSDQAQVCSLSLELPYRDFLIPSFDACIDFTINRCVRHLHFIMESSFNSYVVRPGLFQCSNLLTKLQIHGCAITLPLSPFSLSSLKFMDIGYCCLEKELLERLTSSTCCPALESLKLACCSGEMEAAPLVICLTNPILWHLCLNDMREFIPIVVRAPYLKHLEFSGEWSYEGYMLEDVSTLIEASIHFDGGEHSHDALPLLKALFAAFPPIKLNVSSWVLKVLFLSSMKAEEIAVPAVLKHLNLRNWLHSVHFLPTLSVLFKSLSDIEHLRMNLCPDNCYCIICENYLYKKKDNLFDAEEQHFMLLEQSLQFSNIRTIELEDFYWEYRERKVSPPCNADRRWQFEFVRIILAKLKKLEKLTIISNSKHHGLPFRIAECHSLPRASPEAFIELRIS